LPAVVRLASDTAGTIRIDLDDEYVYWAGSGGVARVPKRGGRSDILTPPMSPGAVDVAIDGQTAFYIDGVGNVARVPTGGGSPTVLTIDNEGPNMIALDDVDVFWTSRGPATKEYRWPSGSVKAVPKNGGPVRIIATNQNGLQDIAVDAAYVYWSTCASDGDDEVARVPKRGGIVATIASHQQCPRSIVLDGSDVFWTRRMGRGVMKMARGDKSSFAITVDVGNPWGLAVDNDVVYSTDIDRTDSRLDDLLSVPRSGGMRRVLATGSHYRALDIACDKTAIFWTSFDHESGYAYIQRFTK
jgi:hypothetical protein